MTIMAFTFQYDHSNQVNVDNASYKFSLHKNQSGQASMMRKHHNISPFNVGFLIVIIRDHILDRFHDCSTGLNLT
jgi:hypothetical protein